MRIHVYFRLKTLPVARKFLNTPIIKINTHKTINDNTTQFKWYSQALNNSAGTFDTSTYIYKLKLSLASSLIPDNAKNRIQANHLPIGSAPKKQIQCNENKIL